LDGAYFDLEQESERLRLRPSLGQPEAAPQIEESRVILEAGEQRIPQDPEGAGPELRVPLLVGALEPLDGYFARKRTIAAVD
jgi:hypothetical protein